MSGNAISIVMTRLTAISGALPPIFATWSHADVAVVVNRTHETVADELHQAVVMIECRSLGAMESEAIGTSVVGLLNVPDGFDCNGIEDVQIQKGSVDFTSYDEERKTFSRTIEFVVSW